MAETRGLVLRSVGGLDVQENFKPTRGRKRSWKLHKQKLHVRITNMSITTVWFNCSWEYNCNHKITGQNRVGKQYVRRTKCPGRLYPVRYRNIVLICTGNLNDKTEHPPAYRQDNPIDRPKMDRSWGEDATKISTGLRRRVHRWNKEDSEKKQTFIFFLTFCWPCISVYLSQYLTNLMHKICFTISFISCLYMFRAVITPEKLTHKFHYYLLIFIELYFSNFRPLTCFSVMIPEAV